MNTRLAAAAARAPLVLLTVSVLIVSRTHAADAPRDDPKPGWRNGPVRYLLTSDEDRAFKALKMDEERTKAIAEFWARRDPTPGTPANEYREDFYKRVDESSKAFRETTGPGWATDRGRVLLIAGYPTEKGQTDQGETWSYDFLSGLDTLFAAADDALGKAAPPAQIGPAGAGAARKEFKNALAGSQKVTFEKSENGDYTLRGGSEIVNAILKLAPRDEAVVCMPRPTILAALKGAAAPRAAVPPGSGAAGSQAPSGTAVPAAGAAGPAAMAGGADAGTPAELPEGVERLRQAALASEAKSEIGMAVSTRFYKAVDGSTRTVVMVAVKKTDIAATPDGKARTVLYARFVPEGGTDVVPVEFIEQELFSFYDDPGEGWLKYAFAWALKKKNYELRVAASDGPDGKIATHVESLVLPDYKGGELSLSSVTVSRSATPASTDPGVEDRFKVGTLRLVPWVRASLGPKDDLAFFYDVYNARSDPATNHPSMDVVYLIEKKEASGWKRRARVPEPDMHEETLGYTIPSEAISQWPAGDYRLTVQVKDKIANADTSSAFEFSLRK